MRRLWKSGRSHGGSLEMTTNGPAVPIALGVSNVFDSFDAVMRLAEMTGVAEDFGEYAASRKATLFYDVAELGQAATTGQVVMDRRARRAERRGIDRRNVERRVGQHVMGAGAEDRRRGERRQGDRRQGERRRSKQD